MARAKKSAKKAVAAKKKSSAKKAAAPKRPVRGAKPAAKKAAKKSVKKKVVKAAKKIVPKATKKVVRKVARKASKVVKKVAKAAKKVARKVTKSAPPPKKAILKKIIVKRPTITRVAPVKKKVKLKSSAVAMQAQQKVYAEGVDLLNLRKYSQAATRFGKAADGPNSALSHSASVYHKICQQRMASESQPKTAEDRYNVAVAMINDRRLEDAGRLLGLAVKQEPKAAHIHYALAVVATLSDNVAEGVTSLCRSIELDPQSRLLALSDGDLASLRLDPAGADLLSDGSGEPEDEEAATDE